MKRGWTRYWVSVSLLLAGSLPAAIAQTAAPSQASGPSKVRIAKKSNEVKLAGLVPGKDHKNRALSFYGRPAAAVDSGGSLQWTSACGHETLTLDVDKENLIEVIKVVEAPRVSGKCAIAAKSRWRTGGDVGIGSAAKRVVEVYGEPDSRSPSTRGGQPLELLYYAFDWAGDDVPQVMEVLCTPDKNGKAGYVVEITLAAPSL